MLENKAFIGILNIISVDLYATRHAILTRFDAFDKKNFKNYFPPQVNNHIRDGKIFQNIGSIFL